MTFIPADPLVDADKEALPWPQIADRMASLFQEPNWAQLLSSAERLAPEFGIADHECLAVTMTEGLLSMRLFREEVFHVARNGREWLLAADEWDRVWDIFNDVANLRLLPKPRIRPLDT